MDQAHPKMDFDTKIRKWICFLDMKNYPKTLVLLHLDTLAYLKIWDDIFGYESRFRIPLSIPFRNYA